VPFGGQPNRGKERQAAAGSKDQSSRKERGRWQGGKKNLGASRTIKKKKKKKKKGEKAVRSPEKRGGILTVSKKWNPRRGDVRIISCQKGEKQSFWKGAFLKRGKALSKRSAGE